MKFVIIAVLLSAGIPLVTSASFCYHCLQGNCGDPFNANGVGVTKVQSDNGWCGKVKTVQSGSSFIQRGELEDDICNSASCTTQKEGDWSVTTCCCTLDYCNAAPRSVSAMTATFTICLALLALFGTRLF